MAWILSRTNWGETTWQGQQPRTFCLFFVWGHIIVLVIYCYPIKELPPTQPHTHTQILPSCSFCESRIWQQFSYVVLAQDFSRSFSKDCQQGCSVIWRHDWGGSLPRWLMQFLAGGLCFWLHGPDHRIAHDIASPQSGWSKGKKVLI